MLIAETRKLLASIASVWPRFQPDALGLALWHSALAPMPYDDAVAGLKALVRTSKFPPAPAELIDATYGHVERVARRAIGDPRIVHGYDERRVGGALPASRAPRELLPQASGGDVIAIGEPIAGPGVEA